MAQKVIDDKLSVRELEKFIKDCKEKKVAKPHKKENEELNELKKEIEQNNVKCELVQGDVSILQPVAYLYFLVLLLLNFFLYA